MEQEIVPQQTTELDDETTSALFNAAGGLSQIFPDIFKNPPNITDPKIKSLGRRIQNPDISNVVDAEFVVPQTNYSEENDKIIKKLSKNVSQEGFTKNNDPDHTDALFSPQGANYREKFDKLNENISSTINRLTSEPGLLASLPQSVQVKTVQILNFLQQNAPKDESDPSIFKKNVSDIRDEDIYKFKKQAQGILNPYSLFSSLDDGTVTAGQVEAVQTLYPALYDKFVQDILSENAGKELSYEKRLKLSIFLNQPLDPSMSATRELQSSFQKKPEQQQQQQGGGPSVNLPASLPPKQG